MFFSKVCFRGSIKVSFLNQDIQFERKEVNVILLEEIANK